jgi:hypothetical protein
MGPGKAIHGPWKSKWVDRKYQTEGKVGTKEQKSLRADH